MVKKEALLLAGPGRLRLGKSGIIPVNQQPIFIDSRKAIFSQEAGEKGYEGND